MTVNKQSQNLNVSHSKMFPFITGTWNPLGGECQHNCPYCWAQKLVQKYFMQKYYGQPRLIERELNRQFKPNDFIFVSDMCDLFGAWVQPVLIEKILNNIKASPAKFLLLTKNPERYRYFNIPKNCTLGCTVESDITHFKSKAPPTGLRLAFMETLNCFNENPRMLSIEPILKFTPAFAGEILSVKPKVVAIGYDNYNNHLPEPTLAETEELIKILEKRHIKVYRKTIREARA